MFCFFDSHPTHFTRSLCSSSDSNSTWRAPSRRQDSVARRGHNSNRRDRKINRRFSSKQRKSLEICHRQGESSDLQSAPNLWRAILMDRSVLNVSIGEQTTSSQFGEINKDHIAGLTSHRTTNRHPQLGDFELGNYILVFPTCRLAVDEVQWNEDKLSWSEPKLLEADLQLPDSPAQDDDNPHPDFSSVFV